MGRNDDSFQTCKQPSLRYGNQSGTRYSASPYQDRSPPDGRDDLWELQYGRWWGWSWVPKRGLVNDTAPNMTDDLRKENADEHRKSYETRKLYETRKSHEPRKSSMYTHGHIEEEEEEYIPVKETFVDASAQAVRKKHGRFGSVSRREEKRSSIKTKRDFPSKSQRMTGGYGSCGPYGSVACADPFLSPKEQLKTMCKCLLGKTRTTSRQAQLFNTPSTSKVAVTERESQDNRKSVDELREPAETSSYKDNVGREKGWKDRHKFRSPFKRDSSKGKRAQDVPDKEHVDQVHEPRTSRRTSKRKLKSPDVPGQEWDDPADVRRMTTRDSTGKVKSHTPSSERSVRRESSTDDSFEYLTFRLQHVTSDNVCPCHQHRVARNPQCGAFPCDQLCQVPYQVQPDPQPEQCPPVIVQQPAPQLEPYPQPVPQSKQCTADASCCPGHHQAPPIVHGIDVTTQTEEPCVPGTSSKETQTCITEQTNEFSVLNLKGKKRKNLCITVCCCSACKPNQCQHGSDMRNDKLEMTPEKDENNIVYPSGSIDSQPKDTIVPRQRRSIIYKTSSNTTQIDPKRITIDDNQSKSKGTTDSQPKGTMDDNEFRQRDTVLNNRSKVHRSASNTTHIDPKRVTIDDNQSRPRGSTDSQPKDTIDSQVGPGGTMDEDQLIPIGNMDENEFKRRSTKDDSQYNLLKSRKSSTMQSFINEFTTLPLSTTHIETKMLSQFGRPSTNYPWMQTSKSTSTMPSFTDLGYSASSYDVFEWLEPEFSLKNPKRETFSDFIDLTFLNSLKSSSSKSNAEERILLDAVCDIILNEHEDKTYQCLDDDLVGFDLKNDCKELGILCDLNAKTHVYTDISNEFIPTEDVGVQLCTPNKLDKILEHPDVSKLDYLMTNIMDSIFCESTEDIKNFQDSTSVDNKLDSLGRRSAKRGSAAVEKEETEYKKKLKQEEYSFWTQETPNKTSNIFTKIDDIVHKSKEKTAEIKKAFSAAPLKQQEESDSGEILETHNSIESIDSYLNPSDNNIQVEPPKSTFKRHYPMSSDNFKGSICIAIKPQFDFKPKYRMSTRTISEEPQQSNEKNQNESEAVGNASLDSLTAVNNKLSKLSIQSFIVCNEQAILPSASSTGINKLGKRSIRMKHCSKASLIPIRK